MTSDCPAENNNMRVVFAARKHWLNPDERGDCARAAVVEMPHRISRVNGRLPVLLHWLCGARSRSAASDPRLGGRGCVRSTAVRASAASWYFFFKHAHARAWTDCLLQSVPSLLHCLRLRLDREGGDHAGLHMAFFVTEEQVFAGGELECRLLGFSRL